MLHIRTVAGEVVRIRTSHDFPPIPDRRWDWSAVTDNYDADCDQDGFFSSHPVGQGPTEEAAIADLIIEIESRTE